jgi:hypothetical protein
MNEGQAMAKLDSGIRQILWWGAIALLLLAIPLYSHSSTPATVLGRYSSSYAIALALHGLSLIAFIGAAFAYKALARLLNRLPDKVLLSLIVLVVLAVAALCQMGIEAQIKALLILLGLITVALLSLSLKREAPLPYILGAVLLGVFLLIPLQFLYAITMQGYFPDEAGWAERARNLYWEGGIYKSTRLQTPFLITPGYGWILAIYGWLLHNVSFSYIVGRIWIFSFNALAVLGIGAVAWRFYGKRAAWISMAFASLSVFTFFTFDFKANYQLKAAVMLVIFAAAQARLSPKYSLLWHSIAGLAATFSMQLHASAIAYPLGLSFVYLAEYLYKAIKARRLTDIRPMIAFGIGAAIGTGFFLFANVLSVGGLSVYLSHLSENRFQESVVDYLRFIYWDSPLEIILIAAGFAFIAWRRNERDRLFFLLLLPIMAANFLTDKYGYMTSYQTLYFLPIGAFLAEGLPQREKPLSLQIVWTSLAIFGIALTADKLQSNDFLLQILRTGQLPNSTYVRMGDVLRPQLRPDDVIVSEADLIWGLPEYHLQIFNYGIPVDDYERMGYASAEAIWPSLAPTVFVDTPRIVLEPELESYLLENGFRLCERYPNLMTVYGPDCTGDLFEGKNK